MKSLLTFVLSLMLPTVSIAASDTVTIGSKAFTEGYLLGELIAQKIEASEVSKVNRRFGLGATGVLFEALKGGSIDFYVEYTGTIAEAILKRPDIRDFKALQEELRPMGFVMSPPLGFNNTYALAVTRTFAQENNLAKISDLRRIQNQIRVGFSHEFMARSDGYKPLVKVYGLEFPDRPQAMEHSLAYRAIATHSVDLIDVYSTDAKIDTLDLKVLEDDLGFFPKYEAVVLARTKFLGDNPLVWAQVLSMQRSLTESSVRHLNAEVEVRKLSFEDAVKNFISGTNSKHQSAFASISSRIWQRTKEHIFLVASALAFSIVVGIPFGILATRQRALGQAILLASGAIQTIPSLALLCFLIPFFGIGAGSALVALCLYGLLPVVTGTFVGLKSIDPALNEMALALGLSRWQTLWQIRLPLASQNILAGIRTSAVIGIGTATLAALIGAGGYGAIIVSGLAINDTQLILMGALPAAALAFLTHGLFEVLERLLIPKGLQ